MIKNTFTNLFIELLMFVKHIFWHYLIIIENESNSLNVYNIEK